MRIALFVIAAAVGVASVVPSQASTTPQLAGMKLVAEKSAPVSETAAAQKNGKGGNQNGNKGYYGGFGGPRGFYALGEYAYIFGDATPTATGTGNGELDDLDLTGDKDLGMMDPR